MAKTKNKVERRTKLSDLFEKQTTTADALLSTLQSTNVMGHDNLTRQLEVVNIVEVIAHLADAMEKIGHGVVDPAAAPGRDAAGGHVGNLVEATMGITGGLVRIAEAISDLAMAVREHQP